MINEVVLVGRLGKEPEVRMTQNGMKVANITLATTEKRKDTEHTEWHRIVAFDKTAGIIEQYMKKGDLVYVSGSIHTKKWQDKDGQDRYTTEITANRVLNFSPKKDAQPVAQPAQVAPAPKVINDFIDDELPPF
jgi:single-strand DNA-binding protein